ncbi:MAG TPA: CopD family protein, partial [Candidatus Limnocylindrales bacterium]|nr:CopD family protein [Candidatus Limnocylindrales bacterium]
ANFFISGSIVFTAAILAALLATIRSKFAMTWLGLLVAIILAASVMTNHAASRMDGRAPLIVLSFLHELATGFWIGGLPFLLLGLFVGKTSSTQWRLTRRFSQIALVSVAVIVFSGVAMSLSYIGSVRSLFGTAYGVMVSAKAIMLGAMLLLGGINFLLLRKYSGDAVGPRLRRLVEAEVGIGITIILTAASLTSQPPAVDLVNDTVDFAHIASRLKPHWPRLASPELAQLSSPFPGRKIDIPAVAPLPAAYTIDGAPLSRSEVADIGWSEYNHHWMGVLVLAMGLLALLARTGHAKWAEYWPLVLIGIAIFIFARGDPECWPLGPQGFWISWTKTEVFQHRMAALLCIAFAIFELRVRRRPSSGGALALVFPLLCAAGGALLLTHSHSLTNVQEEFLAEMSHVPLGILAVLSGWARWLEIRLPPEDRAIPAWIWPVCFALIGVGLLNYREI